MAMALLAVRRKNCLALGIKDDPRSNANMWLVLRSDAPVACMRCTRHEADEKQKQPETVLRDQDMHEYVRRAHQYVALSKTRLKWRCELIIRLLDCCTLPPKLPKQFIFDHKGGSNSRRSLLACGAFVLVNLTPHGNKHIGEKRASRFVSLALGRARTDKASFANKAN
eukprot:6207270-Pleurochrysis_carterae.AAC.6